MPRFVSKPYSAKVWIPSKRSQVVGDVRRLLTKAAGGTTSHEGWGSWVNHNGDTIDEPVVVFEVLYDYPESSKVEEAVKTAVRWAQDAGEKEVLVSFRDGARVYS